MRQALNNNPVVQVAVLAVLIVVVGFLLLTRVVNRDDGSSAAPSSSATPAAPATTEAAPAAPAGGATAEAVAPGTEGSAPAAPAAASGAGFVAGPGLPRGIVNAHESGDAVVLLITRENGIDDRRMEAVVRRLGSRPDSAVFETRAAGISRYSRITQGVDVDRTPALVVIQPKRLADGGLPVASVSYGFRGPDSAAQAVRDALYDGRNDIPYYPE